MEDDTPLRLLTAVETCFQPGEMTIKALRRERDRGNLLVFRIAGKEFTTRAEISKMVERCKEDAERLRASRKSKQNDEVERSRIALLQIAASLKASRACRIPRSRGQMKA